MRFSTSVGRTVVVGARHSGISAALLHTTFCGCCLTSVGLEFSPRGWKEFKAMTSPALSWVGGSVKCECSGITAHKHCLLLT